MRAARLLARAIGWLFVAAIGYHAVLAVGEAVHAGADDRWAYAGELAAIACIAGVIVVVAVVGAVRSSTKAR
ncbi:MAG TPA: hypothetical protein VK771_05525 [Acidimicrobiia bacterium]|nr:hypothetical protein [Acidimicrobiia bacterium]